MPGEEQDEDDAPGGEQPIGDEFVQADTGVEGDSEEDADEAEDASQEEEPAEIEASDEAPEDGTAEPAEADDTEAATSEADDAEPVASEADDTEAAASEVDDAEPVDSDADDAEAEPAEAEVEDAAAAVDETPADEKPQKGPDEVFCTSCGEPIKKQAEVCPHCGVRQEGGGSGSGNVEKNPGIAAIASLILPGAGDLYNGELDRAAIVFIAWFVGGIIWGTIITIIGVITLGIGLILMPLYLVTNFISAYLSYQRTEKINTGELEV